MIDRLLSRRLSAKVLAMTIAFVMLAELVIFIPSASVFRQDWLAERAENAGLLALAIQGVPDYEGSEMLSKQFMQDTDVLMLSAKRGSMTELILGNPPESGDFEIVDIRDMRRLPLFRHAFKSFFGPDEGYLRVIANSPVEGHDNLELIIPRGELKQAMRDYFERILLLSLVISLIVGTLLFLALAAMIVRPVRKLAMGLADFREAPETRRSNLPPSKRKDEIGMLQREFYDLKQSVRASLKQKQNLATLGLAVAKINHDLRNIFTSAQLVSDRMAMDKEERVSNMGKRLVRTIDRGIKLCTDTLDYSSTKEDPPEFEDVRISFLLGEVAGDTLETFGSGPQKVTFNNNVSSDTVVSADPDHTYRIFNNLFRNAAHAMSGVMHDKTMRQLIVDSAKEGDFVKVRVTDTGPGISEKAQAGLFKAFASANGAGSTGLGLTISKELATAQGGDLILEKTGEDGTTFVVSLKAG